ncbi:hypothetical protein EMCRGX_G012241 [Ephydatia muelleri]
MDTGYFVGIERGSGECFLVEVEKRDAATSFPHVRPGSTVLSDEWSSYNQLTAITGNTHLTVNHSLYFVDPTTGAHTQSVEAYKVWVDEANRTILSKITCTGLGGLSEPLNITCKSDSDKAGVCTAELGNASCATPTSIPSKSVMEGNYASKLLDISEVSEPGMPAMLVNYWISVRMLQDLPGLKSLLLVVLVNQLVPLSYERVVMMSVTNMTKPKWQKSLILLNWKAQKTKILLLF